VLQSLNTQCNSPSPRPPGCPLIFHPPCRSPDERARRQEAVYIAQMDLRYDLATFWSLCEEKGGWAEQIFVKLILPDGTQEECAAYLASKGITASWIFPPRSRQQSTRLFL
jgi:hypothetical protein